MKKIRIFGLILVIFLLFSCSNDAYKPGIYEGTGKGKFGEIKVEVLISTKHTISQINILEHADTPGISDEVFEVLPRLVIKENSTEVDAISGATETSNGVLQAIKNALEKAK